ncbi:unnamed protein product [Brachionus calyciflorus]|uniref:Uncharacterized protein n=1 Tax=Brachionus calyciflorus TaxID=104777 RepID=A0A813SDC0_9BILA|nr:unnamed protein product [Brachionus calyciflorus]
MADLDQDLKAYSKACEKISDGVNGVNTSMKNLLPKIDSSLQLAKSIEEIRNDLKVILEQVAKKEDLKVLEQVVKKEDLKIKFRTFENNFFIRKSNRIRFRDNQATFEWITNYENQVPKFESKFETFNKLPDKNLTELVKFYEIPDLDRALKEDKQKALSIYLGFY